MANNFYNNNVLNSCEQHPSFCNNTSPNGCKLCNQIFPTTHALLTHIESHMAQEEVAIRRLYSSPQHYHVNSQTQLGFHRFPSPPSMGDDIIFQAQLQPKPMGMPHSMRRNSFFNDAASQVGSSSQQPIRQMQLPPQFFPYARSFSDDGSKSYILKLEKPTKKIDFIDLVNVDDDNNTKVEALDLDLKL